MKANCYTTPTRDTNRRKHLGPCSEEKEGINSVTVELRKRRTIVAVDYPAPS